MMNLRNKVLTLPPTELIEIHEHEQAGTEHIHSRRKTQTYECLFQFKFKHKHLKCSHFNRFANEFRFAVQAASRREDSNSSRCQRGAQQSQGGG